MRNIGKCIGMVLLSVAVVACGGQNKRKDRTATVTGTETRHEVREMTHEAKTTALDSLRKDPNYGKVVESRYTGKLPAADGPGIDYVLTLNAATDGVDTTYTLDMTYLDAEGQGKNKTFSSKGKQQTIQKVVNKKPTKAVKLTPNDGEAPMYFVIVNDTTLRLVNDSLQEAVSDLNYDIIKVKK